MNIAGSEEQMTWNRTKSFEVFGMACSGLGSFRFASVVPGDFAIQITFKALCSPGILLSFARGIHMTWKVFCMALAAYNLHGTKNFEVFGMACSGLGSFRFGGAADLERLIFSSVFHIQITFQVRCTPYQKLQSFSHDSKRNVRMTR